MYNPLIELKHTDGSNTFIRASDIIRIEKWEENKIFYKNGNLESYYKRVKNISEIVELLNEVENRNELSMFMRT